MTFAQVGSAFFSAGPSSFSLTPHAIGDLILVEVINTNSTSVSATALSSTNVTWQKFGTTLTGVTNSGETAAFFAGRATAASAATVTVTWSGTAPLVGVLIGGKEYSSTLGSWVLDVQGNLDAGGTSFWPSLTPKVAGELYFGLAFDSLSNATAGSTSGFTYAVNSGLTGGVADDPSCPAFATGPQWGDSGQAFGIAALVQEAVSFDAVGPAAGAGITNTVSPITWTHVNNGNAIIVAVIIGTQSGNPVTAVTYGGVTLPLIKFQATSSSAAGSAQYGLVSNTLPQGSNTVSVTFTGSTNDIICGSVSLLGAGSLGTPVSTGPAAGTSVSISVPGTTTGGMIVASSSYGGGTGGGTFSGTNSVTVRWQLSVSSAFNGDNGVEGTVPSTGGGSAQTVGFSTTGASDNWALVAVEVLPGGGGGTSPPPVPSSRAIPPGRLSPMAFRLRSSPSVSDIVSSSINVNLSDSGTGSDSLSADAAIPLADSGVASDSLLVGVPLAESGAGSDSLSTAAAVSLTDSGIGSDSIVAGILLSDSGVGSDSLVAAVPIALADSGTGSDSLAVGVQLPESGAGSDVLTTTAALPLADSGIGSDSLIAGILMADSGVASDTLTTTAAIPLAESGTGASSLVVGVPLVDSGAGSDSLVAAVPIALADSGSGSDSLAINVLLPDSGSGSDVLTTTAAPVLSDSGSGSDALAIAVPLADSGLGSDTLAAPAAIPLADSGAGSDSLSIQTPGAATLNDSGTGTDSLSIVVSMPLNDSGTGSDSLGTLAQISLADLGSASDALATNALIALADSGTGTSSLAVNVRLTDSGVGADSLGIGVAFADFGFGTDSFTVSATILLLEFGFGSDSLFIGGKNLPGSATAFNLITNRIIVSNAASSTVIALDKLYQEAVPGNSSLVVSASNKSVNNATAVNKL